MLKIFMLLYSFIYQIWDSLSQKQKENIISKITELFDSILREFYSSNKTDKDKKNA